MKNKLAVIATLLAIIAIYFIVRFGEKRESIYIVSSIVSLLLLVGTYFYSKRFGILKRANFFDIHGMLYGPSLFLAGYLFEHAVFENNLVNILFVFVIIILILWNSYKIKFVEY